MTTHDKTAKDIMRPAVIVEDSATLKEVLERMIHERRNSLAVVDENGIYVGLVNSNDIIKAVLPDYLEEDLAAANIADETMLREEAAKVASLPVKDFMEVDAPTVKTSSSLVRAAALTTQGDACRFVVVDDDHKPVGVLTRTELKRVIASYLGIEDIPLNT